MYKVKKRKPYSKRICGIDPGKAGGLAIIYRDHNGFLELECGMMMPVVEVKGNVTVDGGAIIRALNTYNVNQTVIEYVNSFPGQGVASSFQFGRMFGAVEGAVRTAEFPVYVTPSVWKKEIGLPKQKKGMEKNKAQTLAKQQAKDMATALFGEEAAEDYWSLAGDDGIAEAALIAAWYIQENEND